MYIYTAILECRPNYDTRHFDIVEILWACLGHFGTWLGHWWDICGTSVGHLCFDLALTWLGLVLDLSWTLFMKKNENVLKVTENGSPVGSIFNDILSF